MAGLVVGKDEEEEEIRSLRARWSAGLGVFDWWVEAGFKFPRESGWPWSLVLLGQALFIRRSLYLKRERERESETEILRETLQ